MRCTKRFASACVTFALLASVTELVLCVLIIAVLHSCADFAAALGSNPAGPPWCAAVGSGSIAALALTRHYGFRHRSKLFRHEAQQQGGACELSCRQRKVQNGVAHSRVNVQNPYRVPCHASSDGKGPSGYSRVSRPNGRAIGSKKVRCNSACVH